MDSGRTAVSKPTTCHSSCPPTPAAAVAVHLGAQADAHSGELSPFAFQFRDFSGGTVQKGKGSRGHPHFCTLEPSPFERPSELTQGLGWAKSPRCPGLALNSQLSLAKSFRPLLEVDFLLVSSLSHGPPSWLLGLELRVGCNKLS